ncbi:MAG: nucleotide-binding protein [Rhodovulum sulfidophilum]|uniref:Nucleotide-binding protein n=1 Tax=Rhodovulum sulfidophilum TaxID=35806 RepID=A0A2W5PM63_RHOSU|nr:MAG: nucleotide-binding protein [Rhodovulum sulfidophilum]
MVEVFGPAGRDGGVALLASRERTGGKGVFPRIPSECPAAALYEDIELTGPATLYSFTVIHPSPRSGEAPFVLALADFGGEARVFGRLIHPIDAVSIGMRLEVRPSDPEDRASYHFVPAGEN